MAKVRVIAHTMHESETQLAVSTPGWTEQKVEPAFVTGLIDESSIPALEEAGIIVQRMVPPEDTEIARSFSVRKTRIPSTRPILESTITEGAGYLKELSGDLGEQRYMRIETDSPLVQSCKDDLQRHDASIIQRMEDGSIVARMPSNTVAGVSNLEWVKSAVVLTGEVSMPIASEVNLARSGSTVELGFVTYDVIVREAESISSVENWLISRGVQILGKGRSKLRILLPENSVLQTDIAFLPEVLELEPWIAPRLHNDRARQLLFLDRANPAGITAIPFDGSGEIIGVADTGLDQNHKDFQTRIVAAIPLGRAGQSDDPHGHGTHVAGSALGDGAASAGNHRGVAYKAKLYFQSLLDSQGKLGGLPVDLNDLFDPAYQAGVRVHNNSWGAVAQGSYRSSSREVDEFVHQQRDMVIVISAGNDGTAADPPPPLRKMVQAGFVNWCSIGAPASAKNAICVGANRSDRSTGGYSTLTYGQAWPNDFPAPPMSSELVSGNPEAIAGFSSRGPTDDYRIKPDVIAPGTDILSCKSSLAPLNNFAGPMIGGGTDYAYDCGTSMSAPLVSGCAALIRQYYRQQRAHDPSAALVKATLINGTRWLGAIDSIADHSTQPNFHQGFGCVDFRTTIPCNGNATNPPTDGNFDLQFIDNWQTPAQHLTFTGQRIRYQFTLNSPCELRLTLTYTDLPGRALQNNLNLFLQMLPFSTRKWIGNQNLPLSIGQPDTVNNVEVIRLTNAQPGDFLIQITAQNLPIPNSSQDYALVVTSTSPIQNWRVVP